MTTAFFSGGSLGEAREGRGHIHIRNVVVSFVADFALGLGRNLADFWWLAIAGCRLDGGAASLLSIRGVCLVVRDMLDLVRRIGFVDHFAAGFRVKALDLLDELVLVQSAAAVVDSPFSDLFILGDSKPEPVVDQPVVGFSGALLSSL